MTDAQLINQDSGQVEWYTPLDIIIAARHCMGGCIDLDPASSATANARINATRYFDKETDGLKQEWFGRVWLNHPYGRGVNHLWINKLVEEYEHERTIAACCITFASTSEKWFRPLLARPQCFLHGRTGFVKPDGTPMDGNTKGSVVTYFGDDTAQFARAFSPLGTVKVKYS